MSEQSFSQSDYKVIPPSIVLRREIDYRDEENLFLLEMVANEWGIYIGTREGFRKADKIMLNSIKYN